MPQTARDLLQVYRASRTSEQEIALIDFMELTDLERWELLFFGAVQASQMAQVALGLKK